ncbi:protein BONZAI 3-like isoform X2 [Carya illinoinensis]|uniref:C2 domain-containing protein n=1 Tax=Carya illinoinensis TaxID=32201 RepID=A0A8T1PXF0_CARIL|nr:protein BONZAI 3-like isoform X2 [Carya illinoinensis]KAG6646091.1 hypothetical protein CIPAW_08G169400 [Carya illinoinensis]
MGNCYSDVEGGKQAVGGVQQSPTATNNNNAGHNDAVEFFYRSRGLHQRFTRVELSLSAINLRDRDIISKSDPMAVVYAKNIDGKLEELGRTEVILNSLNPTWIEKVTVAFQFEIVQPLVFHVCDVDTKFHNIPVKVKGVEGIMSAYASALHNVTLAGPTLFGQVIKIAAQIASQSVSYNSKKYFVLLIITVGRFLWSRLFWKSYQDSS